MKIEEYISSGIIEQYVLGLTSAQEARAVEQMAEQYVEVRKAISAYEDSLEQYALLNAVAPAEELKGRVLGAIKDQSVKSQPNSIQKTKDSTLYGRTIRMYRLGSVAAAVLLLISLGLNGIYIYKYNQTKNNYDQLFASQQEMMANNQTLKTRMSGVENDLHLLMNPATRPIEMKGVEAHPGMAAMVYWNPQERSAYFGNSNLPVPPSGKAYQLWAIIDGKPVDMGMYEPAGGKPLQQMKKAAPGIVQAFAVTIEKEGGSVTPTMDQMIVIGKI